MAMVSFLSWEEAAAASRPVPLSPCWLLDPAGGGCSECADRRGNEGVTARHWRITGTQMLFQVSLKNPFTITLNCCYSLNLMGFGFQHQR